MFALVTKKAQKSTKTRKKTQKETLKKKKKERERARHGLGCTRTHLYSLGKSNRLKPLYARERALDREAFRERTPRKACRMTSYCPPQALNFQASTAWLFWFSQCVCVANSRTWRTGGYKIFDTFCFFFFILVYPFWAWDLFTAAKDTANRRLMHRVWLCSFGGHAYWLSDYIITLIVASTRPPPPVLNL